MSGAHSPFNWKANPQPSIFAGDKAFTVNKDGRTYSEVSREAVAKYESRTGRSRGTIKGLSAKGDKQIKRRK